LETTGFLDVKVQQMMWYLLTFCRTMVRKNFNDFASRQLSEWLISGLYMYIWLFSEVA